jgi:hypothetical protein
MTIQGARPSRSATPPFAALLARSLAVCLLGGAFFGAVTSLAVGAATTVSASGTRDLDWPRVLADGSVLLALATSWGLLLVVPIALPAGAVAAGLIWWLRDAPIRPQRRASWVLLGSISGVAVAASLVAAVSPLLMWEREPLMRIAMAAGAACGAVLAMFESVQSKGDAT